MSPSSLPPAHSPQEELLARSLFQFSLLLVGAFVVSFLALPVRVVSVALAVAAFIYAVYLLVKHWEETKNSSQKTALVLGAVVALFLSAMNGSVLWRWEIDTFYQNCMQEAVTRQAEVRCYVDYKNALEELLKF